MLQHQVLDSLLAEEELVPCSFTVDGADLGYLDPLSGFHRDLAAGTQVRQNWLYNENSSHRNLMIR